MDSRSPIGSPDWRRQQRRALLAFARGSALESGGFGWLLDDGTVDPGQGLHLWINTRMTYVFGLNALAGDTADLRLAQHGVEALQTLFRDDVHGGWYDAVAFDGTASDLAKRCYGHAHVLLAGAVAAQAGVPGGRALFAEAMRAHQQHFWDEGSGLCVEEWSRDWSRCEGYRGANANMHCVEAYLFTADVSGDPLWRHRALSIAKQLIDGSARAHDWRLPEHYNSEWTPLLEHHRDRPADPFRPFGATPGHSFEWARLLLQLRAGLEDPPDWLGEAATALFGQACTDAVDDGRPGIPYTVDWSGTPVIEDRFHWVMAEAVLAATALRRTNSSFDTWVERWWREIAAYFVDPASGSWHPELSPTMEPAAHTWRGMPDAYHAFNALTLPDLPLSPSAALTIGEVRPAGR